MWHISVWNRVCGKGNNSKDLIAQNKSEHDLRAFVSGESSASVAGSEGGGWEEINKLDLGYAFLEIKTQ